MSDRLAVMAGGKVEQLGAPRDVYEHPETAFVADFLGVSNLMRARVLGDRRVDVGGVTLSAAQGDASAAGVVRLTIRPERVRIEPPATQGENRVPATIERFVYLGSTTQVFVALPGGDRVQALVANSGDVEEYDVGAAVTAHLPADALRILADDEPVTGVTDVVVVGAGLAGLAAARDLAARRRGRPRARGARPGRRPRRAGLRRRRAARAARRRARRAGAHGVPRARRGARPHARLDVHVRRGRDDLRPRRGRPPLGGRLPVRDGGGARRLRARRAALRRARRHRRSRRSRGRIRTRPASTTSSWAGWLRSVDALPSTVRAVEAGALALAAGSSERTSLLSELRKAAAVGDDGFYSYDLWESLQVAEGSAEVALRMAAELGDRVRLGAVVTAISVSSSGCRVTLDDGEEVRGGGGRVRAAGQRPPRRSRSTGSRRSGSPRCARSARRRRRRSSRSTTARSGRTSARTASPRASSCSDRRGRSARASSPGSCRPSASPGSRRPPRSTVWARCYAELERMYGPEAEQAATTRSCGCGRPIRSRAATRRTGGRATCCASARCTARTTRRSTCADRTSGSPATWRARCARVAPPPPRR